MYKLDSDIDYEGENIEYRGKGPNRTWHIDGHDKLRPFGFCIHAVSTGTAEELNGWNSDRQLIILRLYASTFWTAFNKLAVQLRLLEVIEVLKTRMLQRYSAFSEELIRTNLQAIEVFVTVNPSQINGLKRGGVFAGNVLTGGLITLKMSEKREFTTTETIFM